MFRGTQCPERSHVIVQADLVTDGRLEEEPQESVDPQGFRTRALDLVRLFVGLSLHIEDPVQLLGLGFGALRELPRLVPQKLLDGPAANAEGAGHRHHGLDLLIEDTALQKSVHPIVRRHRDWIHLLPVCAAVRIVQCRCATTRSLQMKSDKVATMEQRQGHCKRRATKSLQWKSDEVATNEKRQSRYKEKRQGRYK
jgi:hypothetical protein